WPLSSGCSWMSRRQATTLGITAPMRRSSSAVSGDGACAASGATSAEASTSWVRRRIRNCLEVKVRRERCGRPRVTSKGREPYILRVTFPPNLVDPMQQTKSQGQLDELAQYCAEVARRFSAL